MKRKTVSLCVIARDEEATIGMAIKSVLALVDEVIVVDTGSQDNTRIIAEGYGARVVDVPWEDDFAAARNAAWPRPPATGSWSWTPTSSCSRSARWNSSACCTIPGGRLPAAHDQRRATSRQEGRASVRLFRNAPESATSYPIHEQIAPAWRTGPRPAGLVILESDLAIMHEGSHRRTARRASANATCASCARPWPPIRTSPTSPTSWAARAWSLLDDEVLPVAGLEAALGHLQTAWRQVGCSSGATERRRLHWLPDLGAKIVCGLLALEQVDEARAGRRPGPRDLFRTIRWSCCSAVAADLPATCSDEASDLAPPVGRAVWSHDAREDLPQSAPGRTARLRRGAWTAGCATCILCATWASWPCWRDGSARRWAASNRP